MAANTKTVAFQGCHGAYSDLSCREALPEYTTVPKANFNEAFAAVVNGEVSLGLIPIENSKASRVAEVHLLLKESPLYINGEHFVRIRHCLLAPKGATASSIKQVHSHPQALAQCMGFFRAHGYEPVTHSDTAGSAAMVAQLGDITQASVASSLAAELYGLDIIEAGIEDAKDNTTRFVVFSTELQIAPFEEGQKYITSLMIRPKTSPGALGKIMGLFGERDIDILKLESYNENALFRPVEVYVEIVAHAESTPCKEIIQSMQPLVEEVRLVGCYRAAPYRNL
eukprot:comp63175_c0_seq1/m.47938 comp63175_c0_seq1/g.47938  ORF comp63175_c0_seq1/g.47938 comp63175_c0_seq1/m.47938 type:complete len:283 (-) comp63175_c0_seq1:28-876(-)